MRTQTIPVVLLGAFFCNILMERYLSGTTDSSALLARGSVAAFAGVFFYWLFCFLRDGIHVQKTNNEREHE